MIDAKNNFRALGCMLVHHDDHVVGHAFATGAMRLAHHMQRSVANNNDSAVQ